MTRSYLLTTSLVALTLSSSAYATPLSTYPNPNVNAPRRSFLDKAPLLQTEHYHGSINNSYMVILKNDSPKSIVDNHMNFLQSSHFTEHLVPEHAGVRRIYDGAHIKGYAGEFSEQAIEQLRLRPEVDYVEKDQVVKIKEVETQKNAPWGLARVSHRNRLTFGTFTTYLFDSRGGEGVDVYVIDTGIHVKHKDFEGRAIWGKTIPQNDVDEDGNGHGTHCAGTIASRSYGVAKGANVIAVKVLGSNGSGSMSDVVAGVEWAADSAKAKMAESQKEFEKTGKTAHKGSVANMSLGGGKSKALDDVVDAAVAAGMHFAVAAGNENRDACNSSPAASKNSVTVGASDLQDSRADFSNYGPCVDIFGPGVAIKSTWNDGNTNTISGTSMASPHTAGVMAYLLSIYPSETFNPFFDRDIDLSSDAQTTFSTASLYALVRSAVPSVIARYLPAASLFSDSVAPVPPKTISTTEMKKALIALGTKNVLKNLPAKTVNVLLFNNASAVEVTH
ncbi:proteinase B [Marasmius crinis-equi]|uniref:Proteinase B n=1 Tax=Marasmius crinis-equi TaxID=585013 RepID=A0ABR3F9H1_9AGAR